MPRNLTPSSIFAMGVMGTAILLTAWKGSIDYMALALFAVVTKLPGASIITNLFKKKCKDDLDPK